jgi:putative addiction module component (TIGR02574 family)
MNKIDEAWQALKKLPPEEQERMADAILNYAAQTPEVHLTDEQVAEVRRRLQDKNAKTITLEEFNARVRKLIS